MSKGEGALPIADLRFAIDAKSNRKLQIANRKFARYLAQRGWVHLVLLTGICVFLFPFLYMFGTSMKSDEELTESAWFPAVPHFEAASPRVRQIRTRT